MPQFAFFSRDREKRARRTRARQRHARARHYRPIVELLELRALLATDITISTLTTSGGTFSGNSSLQTFTPTAGANTAVVNRTDIESFLNAGTSVTIDTSLGTGTAAGNISYSSTATITKSAGANATLTLRANNNLTISLAISSSANALTIVAIGDSDLTGGGTTTVFAPLTSGGGNIQISGDAVAVDAAVNSGAGTITINANADGAGNQGFSQSSGANLTSSAASGSIAINVNAASGGTGSVHLGAANGPATGQITVSTATGGNTTGGSIIQGNGNIIASSVTLTTPSGGSSAIGQPGFAVRTQASSLTATAGSGGIIINQNGTLSDFNLSAPTGDVSLSMASGSLTDSDAGADITALTATISFAGSGDFGSAANSIGVAVGGLDVNTNQGNQFITAVGGLPLARLTTGSQTTGDVSLTAPTGSIGASTFSASNIIAHAATITLNDNSPQDVGSTGLPMLVNVGTLSVNTAVGGGNQFLGTTITPNVAAAAGLDAGTGSIVLDSGEFVFSANGSSGTIGHSSKLVVNSAGTATLSGIQTVASLSGSGAVGLLSSALLTVGGDNSDTTFSGTITGGGSLTFPALTKSGSGTLTLSGSNSVNSDCEVQSGKLLVTGSLGPTLNPPLFTTLVDSGASVGGTGSIPRPVVVRGGGHLAPGTAAATGTLHTGDLNLLAGSSLDVRIANAGANGFDQANVSGTVTINATGAGVGLNFVAASGLNLHPDGQIIVINNDGTDAVSGRFVGLNERAIVSSNFLGTGLTARITYQGGDGNDVAILLNAPKITSNGGGATAALSVPENQTAVTTVSASDADMGQTLTYSISGGADAAKFAIDSASGVLTFKTAPDFEQPTDADANNVYEVTVQVSDGTLTDSQAISVTVTNANDPPSASLKLIPPTTDEAGAQTVAGWITNESAGPADEANQSLTVTLSVDQPSLFAALPTIDGAGGLHFTPAGNVRGTAILTVTIQDSGGTANGGVDTTVQNETIVIDKPHPWHNVVKPLDATGQGGKPDGHVFPNDALAVINYINAFGTNAVSAAAAIGAPFGFIDTTGTGGKPDNFIAPNDALAIINAINAGLAGEGEGVGARESGIAGQQTGESELMMLLAMDVAGQPRRRL